MTELFDLRRAARDIFDEALKSMDAHDAMRRAVELNGSRLRIVDTTFDLATTAPAIYAIAIGKAAFPMALALNEVIGEHLKAGVITDSSAPHMPEEEKLIQQLIDVGQLSEEEVHAPIFRDVIHRAARQHQGDAPPASPAESSLSHRWRVFAGGHPLPNEDSLRAARASFELLRRADAERALMIFLISGGGSAMIEWARDEQVTLEELRAANQVLISCGASITEINTVRCAFSAVKGGSLAARAPHTEQVSLIVSDTNAGEEQRVASGPTFNPLHGGLDAESIIARYELDKRLPASILRAIRRPPVAEAAETPHPPLRKHYVLLDNERALQRAAEAARRRGFTVEVAHDLVEQGVAEGSAQLYARLNDLHRRISSARHSSSSSNNIACLISGGEFACPVKGDGVGGRNAETALRCAIEMDAHTHTSTPDSRRSSTPMHTVALSAGTDGIDGNSPAAGALADETTIARARDLGLDAQSFLDRSDAYTFFNTLGDAIVTGATATNVRDLRIMLAS